MMLKIPIVFCYGGKQDETGDSIQFVSRLFLFLIVNHVKHNLLTVYWSCNPSADLCVDGFFRTSV